MKRKKQLGKKKMTEKKEKQNKNKETNEASGIWNQSFYQKD
ncbi:MAG: hypothetical protein AABW68_03495 [archaeon]